MMLLMYSVTTHAAYIDSFNPIYLDLIQIAENNPHEAMNRIDSIDTVDFSNNKKAEHYYFKCLLYGYLDYPNKILEFAELGLGKVNDNEQPWLFHHLTLEKVNALDRMGKGNEGFQSAQSALNWSQKNNHRQLQLNALYVMSNLYLQAEGYSSALLLAQKGFDLAPEDGPLLTKISFSSLLAGIYIFRSEFEIAIPFLETVYNHDKAENKKFSVSIGLLELGRANLAIGNTDKGLKQLSQSIELSKELNNDQGIAFANNELAYYFGQQGEYEQAEQLLIDSIATLEKTENNFFLFDSYIQLCQIYEITNQIPKAENYLNLAKNIFATNPTPQSKLTLDRMEAILLAAKSEHIKAFNLLLQSAEEQLSLSATESTEKLHNLRALYEVERSAKENELLAKTNELQLHKIAKSEKERKLLLGLLTLALLATTMFIFFMIKFKKQANQLKHAANYDKLTGLRNRNSFIKVARIKIRKFTPGKDLFLVMIDLDHFKSINDEFGHALGDKVLQHFGQLCSDVMSEQVTVGRVGGEEFMVCITHSKINSVIKLLNDLKKRTQELTQVITAPGLKVSFSAGVCQATEQMNTFRKLHQSADIALYQAKKSGRNQIIVFQND